MGCFVPGQEEGQGPVLVGQDDSEQKGNSVTAF